MEKSPVRRIMFVCLGNICRSPLAQAVFDKLAAERGLSFDSESAGMGAWHVGELADPRARRVAGRHGARLDHRARQFRAADFRDYDLILAMDRDNLKQLLSLADGEDERRKLRLFRDFDPAGFPGAEVPDPYYGDESDFEEVHGMVERTCRALIDALARRS